MGFIDKYKQNQEKRQQRYEERKKEIRMKRVSTEKETVIKVFKKHKQAEQFINDMQEKGYELDDLSDGKKHYSITKGATGAVLLGPLGLIAGRGKNRITVVMKKSPPPKQGAEGRD